MSSTDKIRKNLDSLQLSDIYAVMLFVLYKIKEIPDYATLSRLCYLLDGANLNRLLTFYAGKTITFPSTQELAILTNALLIYQYINIEGKTYEQAFSALKDLTAEQVKEVEELYLKIIPIISSYRIKGTLQGI